MKKWIIAVIGLVCFAPVCFADNWGVGLRVGAAQNDPKVLKDAKEEGDTLSKRPYMFGIEGLFEQNLTDNGDMLGIKFGMEWYGNNKLSWEDGKLTEHTYALPLTVYYKKDNGVKNVSWFAGAGATFVRSELKDEETGWPTDKWSKSKVFPHIAVGAEYRFSQVFALGLDVKYNIDAKVKKDIYGEKLTISDRSGFGAALTGRFYF
ncbi:MAG: outer membrane beta-barrel protein [Elusimicrobiaceae bacterium]|nr:outer membrane beta-barrel protein [Elusimicrobiaceae bacterium]